MFVVLAQPRVCISNSYFVPKDPVVVVVGQRILILRASYRSAVGKQR